ncbi:hypothetical protein E1A91_A06G091900v1 [Gossypium mustelinum]|uniref:DEAD-box RNA helicase Q domain-containing protein n=1 Tax=Gossypium mustelinum TaxID=34275 RepID=A0A5D2YUL1_GOSMU|nr:hypothetical protein E1A91_A06G091900v1 [Gossypium mustelinum]
MYESLRFAYGLLEVLIFVTSITIWNKGIISQIILSFPIAIFIGRNMFAERSKKGISDNKIYHYHLNLGGSVSTKRLTRLPSIPKNDAKFRGYVGIHISGFRNFLLKPELLRSIVDSGFEHPSEGKVLNSCLMLTFVNSMN